MSHPLSYPLLSLLPHSQRSAYICGVFFYSTLYPIWGEYQIQYVCVSVCLSVSEPPATGANSLLMSEMDFYVCTV